MANLPPQPNPLAPELSNPFGSNDEMTERSVPLAENTTNNGRKASFVPPVLDRRDSKRGSIQFSLPVTKVQAKSQTEHTTVASRLARRASSPPPERTYSRGVSFDTFDNRDATDYVFTLNYKHKNYQHTRRSRTFLCGTDQKDYSEFALEWLLDELVDDGDEIVCLRAIEKDSRLALELAPDKSKYRAEAQKILDQVIEKNAQEEKAISVVLELAMGKVQDIIQRMIHIYEPAVLIVGTRGRSLNGMQGLLPGSVSKYCLQQSPVPVIVVRPTSKRLKKKQKRLADPARRGYNQFLSRSEAKGGGLLNKPVRESMIEPLPAATDQEAAAVARAIGVPPSDLHPRPLHSPRPMFPRGDTNSDAESPSPTGPMVPLGEPEPNERVLKSPKLKPLPDRGLPDVDDEDPDADIVDIFSRTKRTPTTQPGKSVGAVVDEVVPEKPKRLKSPRSPIPRSPMRSPLRSPAVTDPNDAGQNLLDILDELTG